MLDDKNNRLDQNGDMNGPNSLSKDGNDINHENSKYDKQTKRNLIVKTNSIPDVHLEIDGAESDEKCQFETGV